ncbi:hypothetical protein AGDE_12713 [Angomonas deanei]|uniref:Transmembrane 9 superfamily member n=1 Tax=Angomonas deanei TaxID=59799 RepID=A0A7G2C5S3_9TRYP|nr:hypothetical protein AGDE_12713 [Angomonas deanei]CAD2214835.1 Endomembrane protein 70, putative [Angomonas deanei]|eukprot:EPY23811.1 hypothetical protein AGDE_12713 [Angomonas deanei]
MGITFYRLGLLAVVALIIGVICCEVSVVLTYATLTLEDHHWWWRSFGSLATCGVLTFIYSLYYLVANLEISAPGSVILYIGYMLGASTLLGLITGTLGFLSSAFFVYFIYSYAKVE